ncbi:phage tail tape measure protein [Agrobacterium pusense]|uniref:phage tail tape measure protein n=1 Tax=Agrobacterium pusense TaxID=648995 RepID=UPI001AE5713B|nr:phage tail tape measure protein [Agrobacterium pusense]MBP2611419.1 hypothetical protein [Agrobacterium pusense]
MSQTDEERLVIMLEARIKDLERNMAKASGTTEKEFRKMSLSSKRATDQMEKDAIRSTTRINQAMATVGTKIGAVGKAFSAGVWGGIAGLGVAGIVGTMASLAKGISEVGDQAKIAGVNVKAFQELKYVAEQNRIGVDALTDGLKELNLRADEFILTGQGSAAEAFQRLGFSAEDLKKKLEDPSALFTEIIGKLGKLSKAAQIRIADEIFGGTGGEKFVQLIDQGEAGIRDTIKAANDLGLVMDQQLIDRAAEVDRRFNQIANTVGSTLKSAIVSAADSLAEFIDGFRDYQNQMSRTLQNTQRDLGMKRLDLENKILEAQNKSWATDAQRNKAVGQYRIELEKLNQEDAKITKAIGDKLQPMQRSGNDTWTPPDYTPPSKTKSSRSASTTQADRERKAVEDLIKELEEELRIVNLSDAAKRASAASRQAGAAATDDERKKVIALNEAIFQEQEARRKADEQTLLYRDLTRAGLDDLFSAIEEGKSFWEAMGDVAVNSLKRIADTMLDDVLDSIFQVNNAASGGGGGFFSNLLGGLFSGGGGKGAFPTAPGAGLFAKGGAFANGINGFSNQIVSKPTMFAFADGAGLMGEAGPEAIMPLKRDASGRLGVSAQGGGSSQSAASSPVNVNYSPTYNVQGSGPEIAQLRAQMARDKQELPIRVEAAVRDARKRNVKL